MNCQLCQKESDAYYHGKLPDDLRIQIEAHLLSCEECTESYNLISLAEKFIEQEKGIGPDPFLSSRIMSMIENPEKTTQKFVSPFTRVLKPAFIITTLAAAIFAGVLIGNIYKPTYRVLSRPVEFALIDDVAIEAVDILSNE
jgi:hypothetical protein